MNSGRQVDSGTQAEQEALRLDRTLLEQDNLDVGFGGKRGQEDSRVIDKILVEFSDLRDRPRVDEEHSRRVPIVGVAEALFGRPTMRPTPLESLFCVLPYFALSVAS